MSRGAAPVSVMFGNNHLENQQMGTWDMPFLFTSPGECPTVAGQSGDPVPHLWLWSDLQGCGGVVCESSTLFDKHRGLRGLGHPDTHLTAAGKAAICSWRWRGHGLSYPILTSSKFRNSPEIG